MGVGRGARDGGLKTKGREGLHGPGGQVTSTSHW